MLLSSPPLSALLFHDPRPFPRATFDARSVAPQVPEHIPSSSVKIHCSLYGGPVSRTDGTALFRRPQQHFYTSPVLHSTTRYCSHRRTTDAIRAASLCRRRLLITPATGVV
ncbi:hypothetical protein R3P38DRAFT_3204133 [Favolaschia claudopus]|uniref:Uncharacterized protein n=1 Tax=Favolaschia claudopus TaxID=2862362 RepID=A0AAW0AQJ6_9AGAR